MNTATYRGMARNAEQRLDWMGAAKYWQLAIDKYPPHKSGGIATLDIEKMAARRDAAASMERAA